MVKGGREERGCTEGKGEGMKEKRGEGTHAGDQTDNG